MVSRVTVPGDTEELRLFQQLRLRTASLTKRRKESQRGLSALGARATRGRTTEEGEG